MGRHTDEELTAYQALLSGAYLAGPGVHGGEGAQRVSLG